jgi:hypothetical protein
VKDDPFEVRLEQSAVAEPVQTPAMSRRLKQCGCHFFPRSDGAGVRFVQGNAVFHLDALLFGSAECYRLPVSRVFFGPAVLLAALLLGAARPHADKQETPCPESPKVELVPRIDSSLTMLLPHHHKHTMEERHDTERAFTP